MPALLGKPAVRRLAPRQILGQRSEEVARNYLRREGYRIVVRNVRFTCGELDLVAWEGECLCFIEVRSRISEASGHPLETIGAGKRRRLIHAASAYLSTLRGPWPDMRFDAVGVLWGTKTTAAPQVTLVRDAFEA